MPCQKMGACKPEVSIASPLGSAQPETYELILSSERQFLSALELLLICASGVPLNPQLVSDDGSSILKESLESVNSFRCVYLKASEKKAPQKTESLRDSNDVSDARRSLVNRVCCMKNAWCCCFWELMTWHL